ncbi:MAG: glycosyltransferase [Bacteriovoracaceae bacterium]
MLENEIFEGDYDLIISFYILHYGMQLTLLSKKYNIPIVQCIRGNDVGKSVFQGENFGKLQFILKSATAVTSVSDDLKKVAQVIAPKVRIESFLNSIDPSKCASQSQKENTFTIASAGKFKFKKGISFLLEAVAGLDFDYKLKLIGDFNKDYEKEIFYKQLEIFGLNESKVELTGNLKRSEVWDEIHSSHVFVQPSLFSEGCPNTLLEAICLKVPIIASDVGAIPQIITHEENGFLVGAGNFLAIKESIEKLYHRSSLGLEFSQEALRRLDINSQDIEKERWLSLIAELLS